MNTINKKEILKTSKWIRFIFMVIYAVVINFALTLSIGLSFIQFLFVLFTSKFNTSIANINTHIIEFFNDSLAFLLFETDDKPFPFKNNQNDIDNIEEAVIDETPVESDVEEDSNVSDEKTD